MRPRRVVAAHARRGATLGTCCRITGNAPAQAHKCRGAVCRGMDGCGWKAGGGCCCSPQGARAAHTAEVRGAREGGSGGADWPARVRERAPLPRAATSRRRRRCAALRCGAARFAPPSPRGVRGGGGAPLRRRQRQRSGGPEGPARRARRMIAENSRPISRGWSGGASAAPPPAGGASASGAPPRTKRPRFSCARMRQVAHGLPCAAQAGARHAGGPYSAREGHVARHSAPLARRMRPEAPGHGRIGAPRFSFAAHYPITRSRPPLFPRTRKTHPLPPRARRAL